MFSPYKEKDNVSAGPASLHSKRKKRENVSSLVLINELFLWWDAIHRLFCLMQRVKLRELGLGLCVLIYSS